MEDYRSWCMAAGASPGDRNGRVHDFDWIVVGSGFGGSVSALRLAQKGYRVAVLESGRRLKDSDFARSTWDVRRFLWAPALGLRGVMRIHIFKDVTALAGAGVGGGSLVFANTLYRPPAEFFDAEEWRGLTDWEETLAPFYDEARRMLGATKIPFETDGDLLLREVGEELGVGDTFGHPEVAVFFGEPGKTVPDPFFGGEGPARAGCVRCGGCMIGCRNNAKNTLVKNYLYFAERNGVEIIPDRMVSDIRPLGAADGSDGFAVTAVRPGAWTRKTEATLTAGGVVVSAGTIGTNLLLARCRRSGSLPRLSKRIGELVRTNNEALHAVTAADDRFDFGKSVAITSSIYPEPTTHIENVTYGSGGGLMGLLFMPLTGDGSRLTRPLKLIAKIVRHPFESQRLFLHRLSWSRRTLIVLTMQSITSSLKFRTRRLGPWVRLQTMQNMESPAPAFIPIAHRAAEILARKMKGVPQTNIMEATLNTPTTAHILGGAIIAADPEHGVVDMHQRAFGYNNLLICDGSVVPANLGVNPSLTITALAEHAMTHVPAPDEPKVALAAGSLQA